jgi:hypothetical protein
LLLGLTAAAAFNHQEIYRVADLQRAVARDPGQWLGRTALVRGRLATYDTWSAPDSIVHAIALVDPGASYDTMALPVVLGGDDPLVALLRHVPVLGEHLPTLQAPRWGADTTYRVQFRLAPGTWCTTLPCYQAVLLDATP